MTSKTVNNNPDNSFMTSKTVNNNPDNSSINSIDQSKLNEIVMKSVNDISGAIVAMPLILGDRLGLYKAMAGSGPMSSEELATKTNTSERYIREWLASQPAAGYVTFDPRNRKYELPPENAMVLADEESPAYMLGAYQIIRSIFKDEEKFIDIFKTGKGLRWGEHHHDLFEGTAKFFRPNYLNSLVHNWIPSLDGVEQKLKQGAKVANIGCGYGTSTIIMAKAYPKSNFYGYDNHNPSIESAKKMAEKEGISERIEFKASSANEKIGQDYDLITFFDCLHDMGDPIEALNFARQSLKNDGSCMIVEPMANDNTEDNLNMVGKIYYSASTLICVPNSLADSGMALGAQAGEKRMRELAEKAGFTKFGRASQTPFNIVYEIKP